MTKFMNEYEKKWFELSNDELESKILRHQIMHDEPLSKASAMVFHALDKVLEMLGIVLDGDVKAQQEFLGIDILPLGEEWPNKVRGMVVSQKRKDDVIPYAWISEALVESNGDIRCEVQLFEKETLWEFHCGVNVTKVE